MYQFIVFLRALACVLITNSHQEEIYPIRILASGGLLGDVIFFAISGYCLYSMKQQSFGKWYVKRLRRVYPPVWLTAGIFLLGGIYGAVGIGRVLELMIYPTHYHFVASILVLYVVFYFVMRFINRYPGQQTRVLGYMAAAVAVLYFILFYTVYDHSYYHIDDVNNKMIWHLFLLSMMIGCYFRLNEQKYLNKGGTLPWIAMAVSMVLYFGTKFGASRGMIPAQLQWINQLMLLVLLACVFRSVMGIEQKIKRIPTAIFAPIRTITDMAFELYLAQAVIIPTFNTGKDTFPHNFVITISVTFLCAWLVHHATNIILYFVDMLTKKGAKQA